MNESTNAATTEKASPSKTEKPVWKFPKKEKIIRLKPEDVIPMELPLTERELRIKEKLQFKSIEPQTGLKERGIRFDGPEGPAWAVEAFIPISDKIRRILKDKLNGGIDIPERITNITYLDLAPQESVYPVKYRTIRTDWRTKSRLFNRGALDKLRAASTKDAISEFFAFLYDINMAPIIEPEEKKAMVFANFLQNIFFDREKMQKKFNKVLAEGKGTDLVIVHGHGGGKPRHMLGEQFPDTVMSGEYVAQREGNRIFTDEIIDMYNDPKTFAAIIFCACNMEGAKIGVKDVPIVHPLGASTSGEHPFASVIPAFKNQAYIKVPSTK